MATTDFNFFDLIKRCAVILSLDVPSTFAEVAQDESLTKVAHSLNSVNRYICLMENERWTFRDQETTITLVSGTYEYTRPDGIITTLKFDNERPLIPEYNWNYLYTATGRPERYNVYGSNLLLYPIPTSTEAGLILNVLYATNKCAKTSTGTLKSNMDLETDFSIIPTQFSDALIYGACRDYNAKPDKAKYQHYTARYNETMKQMRQQMKRSNELETYLDINNTIYGNSPDDIWDEFENGAFR